MAIESEIKNEVTEMKIKKKKKKHSITTTEEQEETEQAETLDNGDSEHAKNGDDDTTEDPLNAGEVKKKKKKKKKNSVVPTKEATDEAPAEEAPTEETPAEEAPSEEADLDKSNDISIESPKRKKKKKGKKTDDGDEDQSEVKEPEMEVEESETPQRGSKRKATDDSDTAIYIGNMSFNTNEDQLTEFFTSNGLKPVSVIIISWQSGLSSGFGIVNFATREDAQSAVELDGGMLDGRSVRLNVYTGKLQKTGGGFQGKSPGGRGGDSEESDTLFATGLSWDTSEDDLYEAFEGCELVDLFKDKETGKSKGCAKIKYSSTEDAKSALSSMNHGELDGRTIKLRFFTPQSGGGGRGGRGGGRGGGGGRGFGGRGFGGRGGGRGFGGRGGGRGFGGRGGGRGRGRGGAMQGTGQKITFGD